MRLTVDMLRRLVFRRRRDLLEIEPGEVPLRLTVPAPAEEQDVDDDIGAGVGAETALRQADRADEIGHGRDMRAGRRIRLVHGAMRGDEGGKRSRLQPADRLCDEVVVEPQAE